ncbi:hypothetical protein C8N47_10189 [Mangrovibacterium marinum]|uniref:CAAX prenyl protease 2/Lysostaphin resistance protein A-like domain-containing protein n=2 Tax=Mangrovibacterium marinum TaxID=1639118 RepID=A0A2T5C660_9BACT|nr:hypothetical protein C8N47_10189 [Mangrovibacterium marinum]
MNSESQSKSAGWGRCLLFAVAFFVFVGLSEAIGMLLVDAPFDMKVPLSENQRLIIRIFSVCGLLLQMVVFSRFIDQEPFRVFGFNSRFSKSEFFYAMVAVLMIFTVGFSSLYVTGQLTIGGINWRNDSILQSVLFFLLVAFEEELLFRGYLLKNLLQSTTEPVALVVSSITFALLHLMNPNIDWIGFVNLVLAGLFLGIAWLYRRNLWLPVTIHFFWNFIQTHLGFEVSGNPNYSILVTAVPSQSIWNGGKFGFEGSIICVVLQLLTVVLFWMLYRKRKASELKFVNLPQ